MCLFFLRKMGHECPLICLFQLHNSQTLEAWNGLSRTNRTVQGASHSRALPALLATDYDGDNQARILGRITEREQK